MKFNLLACITVVFTFIIIFIGCKKDNNHESNSNGIRATLNGAAWQSQYTEGLNSGMGVINLYGYYGKSGDTALLEVDISDTIHINQPDQCISSSFFYSKPDGTTYSVDNYYGGHGSITVTSWDKSAKIMVGKFNGVLYNVDNVQDSLKVENGTFNVSYINY